MGGAKEAAARLLCETEVSYGSLLGWMDDRVVLAADGFRMDMKSIETFPRCYSLIYPDHQQPA